MTSRSQVNKNSSYENNKTLHILFNDSWRLWESKSAAMATGLIDHFWTIEELMRKAVVSNLANIKGDSERSNRDFNVI